MLKSTTLAAMRKFNEKNLLIGFCDIYKRVDGSGEYGDIKTVVLEFDWVPCRLMPLRGDEDGTPEVPANTGLFWLFLPQEYNKPVTYGLDEDDNPIVVTTERAHVSLPDAGYVRVWHPELLGDFEIEEGFDISSGDRIENKALVTQTQGT